MLPRRGIAALTSSILDRLFTVSQTDSDTGRLHPGERHSVYEDVYLISVIAGHGVKREAASVSVLELVYEGLSLCRPVGLAQRLARLLAAFVAARLGEDDVWGACGAKKVSKNSNLSGATLSVAAAPKERIVW